jgi:lambda family phage portal protein
VIADFVDRVVGVFSPQAALSRQAARRSLDILRDLDAGRDNRLTERFQNKASSGEQRNWRHVRNARERAWQLYENNVYARKLVRMAIAQIIGCGLKPESQASKNGKPDNEFRNRAKTVWSHFDRTQKFTQQLHLALQEVILSGEVLLHRRYRSDGSYTVDLVACERLIEDAVVARQLPGVSRENYVYRGIEFSPTGERVAYHVYDYHPQDPRMFTFRDVPRRILASDMIHLYRKDRPDQIRGYTWLAPAILQLRDIQDYQENEMVAATVGACVVAAITRQPSSSYAGGLNTPARSSGYDKDGNPITEMQPGMFLSDLAPGERIEGFNPQRPNSQAEAFITHLLRGLASCLPGIKASSITNDYRESSFSSEKSADNDAWREIEVVQEWLCQEVCQPVYEDVMRVAVFSGAFDEAMDFRRFSPSDVTDSASYLAADWSGPVAISINQKDDEEASRMAIENGTSSPQIEAASRGRNAFELAEQKAAYHEHLKSLGLTPAEEEPATPASPPRGKQRISNA